MDFVKSSIQFVSQERKQMEMGGGGTDSFSKYGKIFIKIIYV